MKISNSKKQLAKIISENGGWREGAKFAAQDQEHCGKQKVISFYINEKPWFRGGTFWRGNGVHDDRIETGELVRGWHQTILSRDEYFHLYPAQDADGWIEWKGGECPVEKEVVVEVYLRKGRPSLDGPKKASRWDWSVDGHAGDIVKYRLHKPSEINNLTQVGDTDVVESKPTIEQLAAEYRNRKDYAERKQQEADAAKADADVKLAELVAAGKAVGLVVRIAAPESVMVITKYWELLKGDEILYTSTDGADVEMSVIMVEAAEYDGGLVILAKDSDGVEGWITDGAWRFIRRPAKGDANA